MKYRILPLVMCLTSLLIPASNSQGSAINTTKRLIEATSWKTFDELLTPDFTSITSKGELLTKAELIRRAKNGILHANQTVESMTEKNYGTISVVTYRISAVTEESKSQTWHTQVYVFRNNQWLLTNSQVTQIQ